MTYEEYLQHHGIAGMRWGRRNGPPYPLLRRNMSSEEKRENPAPSSSSNSGNGKDSAKKEVTSGVKVDTPTGDKTLPDNVPLRKMSDKDLDQAISRMKKEKEYRSLASQDITKGKAWVKGVLGVGGAVALSTYIAKAGKDIGEGAYGKTKTWVLEVIDLFKNGLFDEKKKDN